MRIYDYEFDELITYMNCFDNWDEKHTMVSIPEVLGSGVMEYRSVGEQLGVSIQRQVQFTSPLEILYSRYAKSMFFFVIFSGTCLDMSNGESFCFKRGVYWVRINPMQGAMQMSSEGAFNTISLQVDEGMLEDWEGCASLPKNDKPLEILGYLPLDSEIERLGMALKTTPFQGLIKTLYYEGKSRELLMALLVRFNPRHTLYDETERAIDEARRTLLDNLQAPPTIPELARMSGINEQKLKQGFKTYYGETIYTVLIKTRMSHARELLMRGDMSVKEAAYEVGYRHVSSFIKAFERFYHERPGEFKKRYTPIKFT